MPGSDSDSETSDTVCDCVICGDVLGTETGMIKCNEGHCACDECFQQHITRPDCSIQTVLDDCENAGAVACCANDAKTVGTEDACLYERDDVIDLLDRSGRNLLGGM